MKNYSRSLESRVIVFLIPARFHSQNLHYVSSLMAFTFHVILQDHCTFMVRIESIERKVDEMLEIDGSYLFFESVSTFRSLSIGLNSVTNTALTLLLLLLLLLAQCTIVKIIPMKESQVQSLLNRNL